MGRRQHGEGSVYQRGKRGGRGGQWVAVADLGWHNGQRDRREFTGATPEAAMKKRQAFLDRRRDGFTMPRGRQPTVAEWMLHWLHNVARREVQPTTWHKSYRQKVTDLICPYFERIPLPDLTEEDIEEWHRHLEATISKRTGRPLSASTIGQAHRIMSRALKVAVKRGRIGRNPCSNVSPPAVEEAETEPPTADEVKRILARCETWPNGPRWVLAITTGLRQGEALGLEWADVSLRDPASVTVRRAAAWLQGERVVKPPKSRASRRTVPLAEVTVRALQRHARAQRVKSLQGVVFTDAAGRPVHQRADWADWQLLLADLGMARYRVHDLRHGYATMLLEAGVDPRVVQAMLGWSTIAMVQRYQHVRPVMHRSVAATLDRVLGAE